MTRRRASLLALLVAATSACSDATDVDLLEIDGTGAIYGTVYLDLDGSGDRSTADTTIANATVLLLTSGSSTVAASTLTGAGGEYLFSGVPVGGYRLTLDDAALGDSLTVTEGADPVTLQLGDSSMVLLGASYGTLTLAEALASPPGRRVLTSGIALNARLNFGDGQVHFRDSGTFLRALGVERASLQTGDSVRLLGRIVSDNGRPALDEVTPYVLVRTAQIVTPLEVTTGEAATAGGGDVDAALARIRLAEITDTSTTAGGDFRFWADDGSDSVEVVIRDFLVPGINTSLFRPDTTTRIERLTGLLSPRLEGTGDVRWQILPRDAGDITLQIKQADIGVSAAFDVTEATLGETVVVTVTVTNAGPHLATAATVEDTIPAGTAYVSSAVSAGTYDETTGVWDVGALASGASETLALELEITLATAGTVRNVARSLGLVREVDPNGSNNSVSTTLTITAPPSPTSPVETPPR